MPKLSTSKATLTESLRAARLRRWVVVLGIVAVGANVAAAAYDTWRSYQITVEDAKRELANVSRILAAQTAGNLRTIDVLLRDTVEWYAREGARAAPGAVD